MYRSARTQVHREIRNDIPVVIKSSLVDSHEARAAAANEAAILELLRGLAVPTTLGLDESTQPPALVMVDEDFHGLPHGAPWTIDDFFEVAIPLARALADIHAQGVVHRDINPSNIVRRPASGEVKFIDFDLAIVGWSGARVEEPVGTLAYLPPEQTGRIEHPVDTRADLYALGATFFELLIGRPPFEADDAAGLIHAHLTKAPERVRDLRPDVPDVINLIVARLLEKEPDERYPSAAVLADDLDTCLEHWERNASIPLFELAASTAPQVKAPAEPVGIDDELGEVMMAGGARLLAITGARGSGKTTLLNLARTSFGTGATLFEPGDYVPSDSTGALDGARPASTAQVRARPYGFLSLALRSFAQDILGSSDEDLSRWRDRLISALGADLPVLVDLAPELAPVVDCEPCNLPEVGIQERVQALTALFLDLVWDTHPVLFFDDVDRADPESIEVLAELIASPFLNGLSVLCGAEQLPDRLADVVDDHLDSDEISVCIIELQPLDQRGVTELISHALGETAKPAHELAALLLPVTGGLPGLVLEVLHQQHASGGLWTSPDGAWAWSVEALDALPRIDSIVELLITQFGSLDDGSRQLLGVAACLQRAFDVDDLVGLGTPTVEPMDVALTLEASESIGLLRRAVTESVTGTGQTGGYVFVDHRLSEVAAAELDADLRGRVHLAIVRQMYAEIGFGRSAESDTTPSIASDLAERLAGIDCAGLDESDRFMLTEVYRSAARQAVRSGATEQAYQHFSRALGCCPLRQADRFDLASERAQLAVSMGLATAEADVSSLVEIASDPLERARAFHASGLWAIGAGRGADALEAFLTGLAEAGVECPSSNEELDESLADLLEGLRQFLHADDVASLAALDEVVDERVLLATDLLAGAAPLARRHRPELHSWIELSTFELVRENGVGPNSSVCLAGTAVIALLAIHDRDGALALIDTAQRLVERFPNQDASATVLLTKGVYFQHQRDPIEKAIAVLGQAWKEGVRAGSIDSSSAIAHRALLASVAGVPLDQQLTQIDEALAAVEAASKATQSLGGIDALRAQRLATKALLGQLEVSVAVQELEALLDRLVDAPDRQPEMAAEIDRAMVFYALVTVEWWSGRPDNAWKRLEAARLHIPTVRGMAIEANTMLLVVLSGIGVSRALRRRRSETDPASSERHKEVVAVEAKVEAALQRLARLVEVNPDFHSPFHALADAEWGRHLDRPLAESVANYQAAIAACGSRYPHLRALANQRHGELWAAGAQRGVARSLFEEARRDYQQWKCQVRVAQLNAAHPELSESRVEGDASATRTDTDLPTSGGLDVDSVTKATRAIAAETTSHGLFSALMKVLVEYAGAQSGALVSVEDGNVFVEASIALDTEPETGRQELTSRAKLATRAVNFVRRTKTLLVVGNASSDARFRNDQHVRSHRVRSLAVVPIELRGELWGVLYLENNALTSAFTPEHVKLLRVIAGQAAVSVQQVRVFEELEQRVESRTRELADKSRRISALLDHLPQAVLTIGNDRLIEPQYSARAESVLGAGRLAGRDVMEVVFADSSVDADTINRCQSALDFSFGLDEFMARLNWPHLIERFTRTTSEGQQIFSVDWAPIVDDDDLVQQVLVSVRDITAIEQARATATAATRDLSIMQEVFSIGFSAAQDFLNDERPRLQEITRLLEEETLTVDGSPTEALRSVFRLLHTMKGNARTIGLTELVAAVHSAEEPVAGLSQGQSVPRKAIEKAIEEITTVFNAHDRLAGQGSGGAARSSGGAIEDARVSHIRDVLDADEASARRRLDQIRELLDPPTRHTLAGLVEGAARGLPSLAAELGKPEPRVSIIGPTVVLGDSLIRPLRDALVHLLRNALDHGIEDADERRQAGKQPAGSISVEVAAETGQAINGFRCRIFDDGRGLALDRLRAVVAEVNDVDFEAVSDEEAAEMIFRPGLSTNLEVSSTSGRGVGMDAVRQFLGEQGGVVGVEFRGPEVDGYRPFAITVDIPALATFDESSPAD